MRLLPRQMLRDGASVRNSDTIGRHDRAYDGVPAGMQRVELYDLRAVSHGGASCPRATLASSLESLRWRCGTALWWHVFRRDRFQGFRIQPDARSFVQDNRMRCEDAKRTHEHSLTVSAGGAARIDGKREHDPDETRCRGPALYNK